MTQPWDNNFSIKLLLMLGVQLKIEKLFCILKWARHCALLSSCNCKAKSLDNSRILKPSKEASSAPTIIRQQPSLANKPPYLKLNRVALFQHSVKIINTFVIEDLLRDLLSQNALLRWKFQICHLLWLLFSFSWLVCFILAAGVVCLFPSNSFVCYRVCFFVCYLVCLPPFCPQEWVTLPE